MSKTCDFEQENLKIIVMMIIFGRTKFVDNSYYMPMRLSDLSKTFRLRDSLGKGFFLIRLIRCKIKIILDQYLTIDIIRPNK